MQEVAMRAFSLGVVVAVLLGIGAGFGLPLFQKSSADAFSTSGVRLDSAESVNNYGRAG
jgi:hypothetical protein